MCLDVAIYGITMGTPGSQVRIRRASLGPAVPYCSTVPHNVRTHRLLSQVWLSACSSGASQGALNQRWSIEPSDNATRVVNSASGLCLDAGASGRAAQGCASVASPSRPAACLPPVPPARPRTGRPPRPCDAGMPLAAADACNPALPIATRVAALVAAINATEAVGLFNSGSAGVPRLGIPPIQWWNEALHGASKPRSVCAPDKRCQCDLPPRPPRACLPPGVASSPGVSYSPAIPGATSFPQVVTTSQAWNETLWAAIGATISTEARAMNNAGLVGGSFWTPNVNIFRDPRYARVQTGVRAIAAGGEHHPPPPPPPRAAFP